MNLDSKTTVAYPEPRNERENLVVAIVYSRTGMSPEERGKERGLHSSRGDPPNLGRSRMNARVI